MISNTRRALRATEDKMAEAAKAAQEVIERAQSEGRSRTEDENAEIAQHYKTLETLKGNRREFEDQLGVEEGIEQTMRDLGPLADDESRKAEQTPPAPADVGTQFVESKGYQDLVSRGITGQWSTGQVGIKTTLVEGDNVSLEGGTPGAGAPLVPIDQRPGIMQILFQRLTVADLLASATTTSNAINYVVETVADAGSIGTVDESALKPEAEFEFDQVQEPVRKIASFLPVTEELMSDAPALKAYLNARLSLFVRQEEENQLLNGAGTGTDLNGVLTQVPVANQGVVSSATSANDADHIYAALSLVRDAFLEPDGIVVNPADWATLRLLKDGNDNYIGGSPFSNTGSEPGESLWSKRVIVTNAIAEGTALVGAFGSAAQIFRKGGLTTEASNSHNDYFRRNLVAIRAEERLALAVYRPEAFATADVSGS